MNKQKILFLFLGISILTGVLSYNFYQSIYGELITKNCIVFVGSSDTISAIEKTLSKNLDNEQNPSTHTIPKFNWLANQKNYSKPKAGKYILTKGMSLNDVINLLRSGNQTPVKVSFNNQDTLEKFSGRISSQIEADSISILKVFKDSVFLKNNKLTTASVLGIIIPNTY